MEVSKEELEAFFMWLKEDGIVPKKSERLWRKTITQKLLNDDKMTQDNFDDFIKSYSLRKVLEQENMITDIDLRSIIGTKLRYQNKQKIVKNAIDAGSYIHLFFTDGTDTLTCKDICINLLNKKDEK